MGPETSLFTMALGLQAPWSVTDVRFDIKAKEIHFFMHSCKATLTVFGRLPLQAIWVLHRNGAACGADHVYISCGIGFACLAWPQIIWRLKRVCLDSNIKCNG